MKRILSLVFFFMIASLHADDAAKWEGYVKKYTGIIAKYQKNLGVAKSRLNVSKKKLAAQPSSAKWQKYVKKYTSLVAKYEKTLKKAEARLKTAKAKLAEAQASSGGDEGAGPAGPPVNTNLTQEEYAMLKEIQGQKSLEMDHTKVLTVNKCKDCHGGAIKVWKKTPHSTTFDQLHKRKRAKQIMKSMGMKGSMKRNDLCHRCHYTRDEVRGKPKVVSGVSCESCHGVSADWVEFHNDKTRPRQERISKAMKLGMNNTDDVYLIAQNCYRCHSIPNENLVNVGGHKAGSDSFEIVRWSQGMIRHNYIRGDNVKNAKNSQERLRVMFVVGAMLDLEYALRGIGIATKKGRYFSSMMKRADTAFKRLNAVDKKSGGIAEIKELLKLFKGLNFNNKKDIAQAADFITIKARKFTKNHDGTQLASLDKVLPAESSYVWKATKRK
ncbi:cytochrome c family protein [Candidatus Uabimicrobium amorphum]|uniref:Cytochrome c554 n=1 Tax=Uabimicrobium amorphum TaxID=2596890 RepID=A0A5S9IP01_UABAM|nr:cytochrome c family protein [Candidatus Uabimicrobium amorphum]BBM84956.1 cytochrome c554 [Candidatus Uabimicrobium amorphum]